VKAGVGNTHTQHDPSFHRKKVLDFGNEKVAPDNGKEPNQGKRKLKLTDDKFSSALHQFRSLRPGFGHLAPRPL
jgi:hypothetical protein